MIESVTEKDLEQIRAAAIDCYRTSGYQFAHLLVPDLERAVAWIDPDGVPRLTDWEVVEREGKLSLERRPPWSNYMIYFCVTLEEAGGRWTAGKVFERHVRMSLGSGLAR